MTLAHSFKILRKKRKKIRSRKLNGVEGCQRFEQSSIPLDPSLLVAAALKLQCQAIVISDKRASAPRLSSEAKRGGRHSISETCATIEYDVTVWLDACRTGRMVEECTEYIQST